MKTLLTIIFFFAASYTCFATKDPWDKDQSKWTTLMKYAYKGDTVRIDSLLSRGENVNQKDINGWTALKVAVKKGRSKTVAYLLRHKADPNLADNEKMTPLMEACIHNHYNIANLLLETGANPNQTNHGWTALMGATSFADTKLMELLIKYKANVNAKRTIDGMTALGLAIYNNNRQKIDLLKRNGAE
jgi:ankyrin repeat protein